MKMKLDWKAILITAVVAIVAVVYVYPLAVPYLRKIPVLGKWI